MRVIRQSVSLEGVSMPVDDAGAGTYLELKASPGAFAIERAARTCYKSEGLVQPGSAKKLVAKLKGMNHEAMLEFGDATFRVVCDRGVSHEFVRHRLMSFAQESTRYCNYAKEKHGNEIAVVEPPGLDDASRLAWSLAVSRAESAYMELIERGVAPQIARSVLPTCLKTELVAKANFREWLHFLKLRTSSAAHPQMREVAEMIRAALVELCPEVFGEAS